MTTQAPLPQVFPPPCSLRDETCTTLFFSIAEQQQGRRVYAGADNKAFSDKAKILAECLSFIEDTRGRARNLLQRSKETVYKKWRDLKPDKRRTLLLKYCEHLKADEFFDRVDSYQISRGEFFFDKTNKKKRSLVLDRFRLDELTKDWTSFLALIHNRIEFGPEVWLPSDSHNILKYWIQGIIQLPFSTDCVLTRGSKLGTLIAWDAQKIHRRDALPAYLMITALAMQAEVSTLVYRSLVELAGNFFLSGNTHLWDTFISDKGSPATNGDVNFPLVHSFSVSPIVSIESIMTLVRTRSEAQEDLLVQLQSDISFFLEKVEYHRHNTAVIHAFQNQKMPSAEMMTLVPEFEARIFWHLLLELLERLRNVLAADGKDGPGSNAPGEQYERVLRDVNYAVDAMRGWTLRSLKFYFFSSSFGVERLKKVFAAIQKTRPFLQDPYQMLDANRAALYQRPIAELIPEITDAELLREDWLAWCVDNVACGETWTFQNLRRLLQYLQTNVDLVKEMPDEVTTTLECLCVIYKVWEFLHYCVPGPLPVNNYKMPPEDDDCWMLWYAAKDQVLVDASKEGGEVERKAAGLKVQRCAGPRNAEWLARSDAGYAQFDAVHLSAVNTYIQMLNCAKYKTKSTEPIHIQSLLLLFRSHGLTPISAAERAQLTETTASPANAPPLNYISPPQQAEKKPQKPKAKSGRKAITNNLPDLRNLRLSTAAPSSSSPKPSSKALAGTGPIELSGRAFQIAEQLFSSGARQGRTTFSDIQFFMGEAGFACKQLPGAARLFRRQEGLAAIEGHKSITVHEPHVSKYTANQLDNLKTQMKKRFGWSMDRFKLRDG